MRLNRLPGVASNPEPAGGHRAGAGVVRVLSVTAVAVAACALSALPAMAASSAAAPGSVVPVVTVTNPSYIVTEQAGTQVMLTATVTSPDGTIPTGTVTFEADPANPAMECTVALDDTGTAACPVTPAVGVWGFTLYEAAYTPTAGSEWAAEESTGEHKLITPDNTTTTVTGPATALPGAVTLNATIVPYTGPDGVPYNILGGDSETGGDTVAFTVNGATVCAAAPMTWNGTVNVAACADTLAAGTYTVVAAYSGDEYTNPSTSVAFTLVVKSPTTPKHTSKTTASASPKTALIHKDVKLSATVTSADSPTGTVTFWVSTRKLCTAKVVNGKATCDAAFSFAGKKTVVAKYSGDSTHDASSGTVALTIKR
jgi:large repetitive protein